MVKSWDRVFKKVGETADPPVPTCNPHRFRDTFAVSLLLKGVSLDSVSKLLGHSSIKITERHYAPWVKARQEQLEAEVRRIWRQLGVRGAVTCPPELAGVAARIQKRGSRRSGACVGSARGADVHVSAIP